MQDIIDSWLKVCIVLLGLLGLSNAEVMVRGLLDLEKGFLSEIRSSPCCLPGLSCISYYLSLGKSLPFHSSYICWNSISSFLLLYVVL